MKKKKILAGEYKTLKEARAEARARSVWRPVDVYQEPNGTYSVGKPLNNNATFVVAVDKSGAKFKKLNKKDIYGYTIYVPVEKKQKGSEATTIGAYRDLATAEQAAKLQLQINGGQYIKIYKEPDGSYSVQNPVDETALLVFYIDRRGYRYSKTVKYDFYGNKKTTFELIR